MDGDISSTNYRIKDEKVISDIMRSSSSNVYINNNPISNRSRKSLEHSFCGAGRAGLTISPYGEMRPCIPLVRKMGVYPKDSLLDVWQNSDFFEEFCQLKFKDIGKCSKCSDLRDCAPCIGTWRKKDGNYVPDSYTCLLAKLNHESQN